MTNSFDLLNDLNNTSDREALVEELNSGFDSTNVNKAAIQSLVVSPKLTSYSENMVIGTSIADLTMESAETNASAYHYQLHLSDM